MLFYFQAYLNFTVVTFLKARGHKTLQQVLCMHLILPLPEGHLSNEDRIILQKGYPYWTTTHVGNG